VALTVDTNGSPQNVRILRGLGHGLDEMAVKAVSQYRFQPAEFEGSPVPVEVNIEVSFKIN
jgi:TonB family protein